MKRHKRLCTMEGVVVVERRSGSLHYTRSFTKRFERRHPARERMNLGALFFALLNFASNSVADGHPASERDAHCPAIVLLETAAERIVLAQSVTHELLIVLFVERSVDTVAAKSLVERIASHYDCDLSLEMRLATVLGQRGKLFREACEKAIQDEADKLLQRFAADYVVGGSHDSNAEHALSAFILFYYSPSLNSYQPTPSRTGGAAHGEDDDDHRSDDEDNCEKTVSRCTSPTTTRRNGGEPPKPLQKLITSTRSLGDQCKRHVKKNAVMDHAEPKAFRSLQRLPAREKDTNESLAKILDHPQFAHALVDALQPNLKSIAALMLAKDAVAVLPTLKDVMWRQFPLPRLSWEGSSAKPIGMDLRLWKRDGCLLVYPHHLVLGERAQDSDRARVVPLLEKLEPLARGALDLAS